MRAFINVLRFELRLHFTSPLFWGVSFLFFALHLLTLTRTGINVGENEQIAINSASLIFQTHLVIGVFGMLPAIAFAVTAMTRDSECRMTEFFFTTPVKHSAFLMGRFLAGTMAAMTIGCIGVLGALAGSFMPWLDPARVTPFDWRPWASSLVLIVLPNLIVFCALFFSAAALTRSTALTFGAALGLLVFDLFVNLGAAPPVSHWLLLADPFGRLPVTEAARYWTVGELNARLPTALLGPNRLLWLSLAFCALLFTVWRYRMELPVPAIARPWRMRKPRTSAPPPGLPVRASLRFDTRATVLQLLSQMRMDSRGVWLSQLFWLVLVMAAFAVWGETRTLKSPLFDLPIYPATSLMLDVVGAGLFQFLLLAIIYYSAALVFRERDAGLAGVTGALPCPDWIPVVSKTLVLCGIVLALFAVTMVVLLSVQALAGFHEHNLGVLLEGIFIFHGFSFCILCVLAVLVQVLSPGKWSGMVFVLLAFVTVLSLPALGFDHLLYGFRIPSVTHSDMNGFGHDRLRTYVLIAYWTAFCVLLLSAGHLLFPRGSDSKFRERLRDARARLTAPIRRTCTVAALAFVGFGAFVFYNINVLNDYVTSNESMAAQARYEREYGLYRDAPAPSIVDPDLHVELYAAERRLTSRGTMGLRNNKSDAIGDFVLSVDPRNRVDELIADGAKIAVSDPAQGYYLFRPDSPLAPGATLKLRWSLTRENKGFPNSDPDNEIVGNGTYLRSSHYPIPGYRLQNELVLDRDRKRFGLPPVPRLPALGDPAHLDDVFPGVDSRSSFRIVIGTDAGQTAVSAGMLRRTWQEKERRYFEYALEGPVWPAPVLLSAHYTIARDEWNGVALEIYHHSQHGWNVQTMLETAKQGLDYYSREFGRYSLPYFRMAEYARYRSNVQAGLGTIAYSEGSGFLWDLRGKTQFDCATLHELAHQWWGNVYGARMQGRQLLNEGLAEYSRFMMHKEFSELVFLRRCLAWTHDSYLQARKSEPVAEQPVAKTEDQAYISYGKAPLVLFALQELIGADKVNAALRAYYTRFVDMKPPFPTSLDLVAELRATAEPEHQNLITDLFEKIVLYDVGITAAEVRPVNGGYEVVLDVSGRQFEASGNGAEREVPLDTWFQVAFFRESNREVAELNPLYVQHHRLRTGTQRINVHVAEKPGTVAVDPFHLMIDRRRDDNLLRLPVKVNHVTSIK